MPDSHKDVADELRRTLKESHEEKMRAADADNASRPRFMKIRSEIEQLVVSELKPVFEEAGRGLEVNMPADNTNVIEVLYYPKTDLKRSLGVNTAALRIEYLAGKGVARIQQRDSFIETFHKVDDVNLTKDSPADTVKSATIAFVRSLAQK